MSLVVPGSSERMLAKARDIDVEELVVDLEDAVIPERKSEALAAVLEALDVPGFQAGRVLVRVNAIGTAWAHQELIALTAAPHLAGVVVPKVESPGDLAFVDRLLDGAELAAGRVKPLLVQALIETARGLTALHQIVSASPRLEAIILGYADLSASLGRSRAGVADLDRWLAVQDIVLVAARSGGVQAIDGPHLKLEDADGLVAAARRAADLGFDGKWAIHPSQLAPLAAEFTPSPAEVEHAESVLEALARAARDGGGAVAMDGEMLDEPVRLAALRTLARAGRVSEPAR
ncbi:MAG: CoA ester lyase [Actinomycetota bacterium]|nr:CoA ester lyase [Actinomycetota bacterium]